MKDNDGNQLIVDTYEVNNINEKPKNLDDNAGNEEEEANLENGDNNKEEKKLNKKSSLIKKSFVLDGKEELEDKITNLQKDYYKLENKPLTQLEEEFFLYLELDDPEESQTKMEGNVL